MGKDRSLVYSTGEGRICPDCHLPWGDCICREAKPAYAGSAVLKVRREVKGRKGKTVTTVSGVGGSETAIEDLAKTLKQALGTGGSVKEGVIVIQGDHRKKIVDLLTEKGFTVKLAGG
ncbi:stress response translation initiation inhibitor YciH [bacterium]|nr:stress response translation initiation inhibitor YciH [bacterium]